jgi:AcrR family transcriptional regulator
VNDKKIKVCLAAEKLFRTNGIAATKMIDLANSLKMSKKTLYMMFGSKENLVNEVYMNKVESLDNVIEELLGSKLAIHIKLLRYLEITLNATSSASSRMYNEITKNYPKLNTYLKNYVDEAVYGRFKGLLFEARRLGVLNENSNIDSVSILYSNAIRNYLSFNMSNELPGDFKPDITPRSIYYQNIITIFRGMLNEKHLKLFNEGLKSQNSLNEYS